MPTGADLVAWLAGGLVLPATVAPLVGLCVRGTVVVGVYVGVLVAVRFFQERELRQIRRMLSRARPRRTDRAACEPDGARAAEPLSEDGWDEPRS